MNMESGPVASEGARETDDDALAGFSPVPLQRRRFDGWTADRQRLFLRALAETGSVSQACHEAGITARSAYRLRAHPLGRNFSTAWNEALRAASAKLLTLAYERAVNGNYVEHWRDGKLVGETRQPSDKLLMYLLNKLLPHNHEAGTRWAALEKMSHEAGIRFTVGLDAIADCDTIAADPLGVSHYIPQPRLRGHEPDEPLSEDGEA